MRGDVKTVTAHSVGQATRLCKQQWPETMAYDILKVVKLGDNKCQT